MFLSDKKKLIALSLSLSINNSTRIDSDVHHVFIRHLSSLVYIINAAGRYRPI